MNTKSLYPIIFTDDMEGTLKFYTEFLDFSIKHNNESLRETRIVILSNPNGDEIEVIECDKPKDESLRKIKPGNGFRMNVSDMEETLKEVKERGYTIIEGPVDTFEGRVLRIRDNNGVRIAFIQHLK